MGAEVKWRFYFMFRRDSHQTYQNGKTLFHTEVRKRGRRPKTISFEKNVVALINVRDEVFYFGGFTVIMCVATAY